MEQPRQKEMLTEAGVFTTPRYCPTDHVPTAGVDADIDADGGGESD